MDELRTAVMRRAAGFMYPEDLPGLAADALVRGVDSPSLRELAGVGRRDDTSEILALYAAALDELNIAVPGTEQAVRRWLRELAEALVADRVTVDEAVARIVPPEEWMFKDEFDFAALGYYWDDLVDPVSEWQVRDAEIEFRELAAELLANARS